MAERKLVDYMTKYPQRCIITGAPNKKGQPPVFDLGVVIPEYGRVYVSRAGMDILAKMFGYAPVVAEALAANELEAENAQLRAQVSAIPLILERTLNGLRDLSVAAAADLLALADRGPDAPAPVAADVSEGGEGGDGGPGPEPAEDDSDAPRVA